MCLGSTVAPLLVDGRLNGHAQVKAAGSNRRLVYPQLLTDLLNVVDLKEGFAGHDAAAVCHLAASFGV